jgi:hypothetical protein
MKVYDVALPIGFFVAFVFMAMRAAECDTSAGRTITMDNPTGTVPSSLGDAYQGCKGTPIEVATCYWANQPKP